MNCGSRCWLALLCLAWAAACLPRTVRAEVIRHAILVAHSRGDVGQGHLRHTHNDARRLQRALTELGDFRPENLTVLLDQPAEVVTRVLITANAKIRSLTPSGDQAVLFVYYSGHADERALQLGSSRLKFSTLQNLIRGSAADLRVLMVDACNSGALTRAKGPTVVPAFPVDHEGELASEGLAYLTSSAAGEDAHESDEIGASFFTHYFVSALHGAGDRDHDGGVSLAEAYAFAYEHTLRASSRSRRGAQHPTYAFDLRGQGSFQLTTLKTTGPTMASLDLPAGRDFLIFEGSELGAIVAEIGSQNTTRRLWLPAGRYFLRGRGRDHLVEGLLELRAGQHHSVRSRSLARIEFARLARKGSELRRLAHGPQMGVQLRSASPGPFRRAPCMGPSLGYTIDTRVLSVTMRLSGCWERYANEAVATRNFETALRLGAVHVWDFGQFALGLGVNGGYGVTRQRYESRRQAPSRWVSTGMVTASGQLIWNLPRGAYLQWDLEPGLWLLRRWQKNNVQPPVVAELSLQSWVGAGWRF